MSQPSPALLALCEATIFTGEAMVEGHALLIKDGTILDIVANGKIPAAAQRQSWARHILVPGFIDTQVNGGGNHLFNADPTAETGIAIAKAHQACGTTRLLLTCITDVASTMNRAIAAMRAARAACPNILGLHIEGPHLSLAKRGVHRADCIRGLTAEDISIYRRQGDEIMLVTVAPENATPEQIRQLCQNGTLVALGHSQSSAEQTQVALAAGATGFTHLFNAMGSLSARAPGIAGVALDDCGSWCGLIVDGYHVSPEMVRLAIHAKTPGKIMLVSDAMPPAADSMSRPFTLYGEPIHVDNGRCVTADGRLAGSTITLSDAIKNCVQMGIDIDESLRMASTYPAAFLGLEGCLGKLLPTYRADIVALDHAFNPQHVWVDGR